MENHDYECPECGHKMDTWDEYKYHYLFCGPEERPEETYDNVLTNNK
jgi:ssDNA-binding Zn-finger/Zn-ribbon topoisomerase 1